jgi:hypothetical protein
VKRGLLAVFIFASLGASRNCTNENHPQLIGFDRSKQISLVWDLRLAREAAHTTFCASSLGVTKDGLIKALDTTPIVNGEKARACQTEGLVAFVPIGMKAIVLCPLYWSKPSRYERATYLVHEAAHIAGMKHAPSAESSAKVSVNVLLICVAPLIYERERLKE